MSGQFQCPKARYRFIAYLCIIATFCYLVSVAFDIYSSSIMYIPDEVLWLDQQPSAKQTETKFIYPQLAPMPQSSYPEYNSLLEIVESWNPDNPDPPSQFEEKLQHFNYSNDAERKMAEIYRDAELPFKLYNVPEISKVSMTWTDEYLSKNIKRENFHVEKSKNNHFMYWNMNLKTSADRDFKPPTKLVYMPYSTWRNLARRADNAKLSNITDHFYFMTSSLPKDYSGHSFISRDLALFSTRETNFFIRNPKANKGIQCRFGMRGIIAESHFDEGRNMVAMLKGEKRYILNPPSTCKKLGIITDTKHPSYRHSVIDWSDTSQVISQGLAGVDSVETILREGEVLYIPSFWFHYIISLRYSVQCNSRSGSPPNEEGLSEINNCLGKKRKTKRSSQGGKIRQS